MDPNLISDTYSKLIELKDLRDELYERVIETESLLKRMGHHTIEEEVWIKKMKHLLTGGTYPTTPFVETMDDTIERIGMQVERLKERWMSSFAKEEK